MGGALVWAGGARNDAGHQRVVEIPRGRDLRVHPRRPPAPADGRRRALSRSRPTVGGLQIAVLGNEDVVLPVLSIRAEGGGHLNTAMIKQTVILVIFKPLKKNLGQQQKPAELSTSYRESIYSHLSCLKRAASPPVWGGFESDTKCIN